MPPRTETFLHYLHHLVGSPEADAELLCRWIERRDEDAFAALVTRHGRMVHGVCRRILGNRHDADDAFQAVFLILARKAATLRHPAALAAWLHGVAVRLANKVRSAAARRRGADLQAVQEAHDPQPDPLDVLSGRELLSLIDEEIARLPEAYRLPVLLCDVEERTQPEAARFLGWTLGSLRGRLLRGRAKLRTRLLRRGIAPDTLTVVLAAGLAQANADAAVLPALASGVSRLAVLFSTCPSSATIPIPVAELAQVGLRGMMLTKLKLLSAVVLTVGLMTAGAGLAMKHALAPPTAVEHAENKSPVAPPAAAPPRTDDKPRLRRDQDGDPLPDQAIARLGTLRFRAGGTIKALFFADDGKTLISSGNDGMHFWDVATGKDTKRFADQSFIAILSPDGKWLAHTDFATPTGRKLVVRDFTTGRVLRRFGTLRTPSELLFSPDSKILAAFAQSNDIELWDHANGRLLQTLKGHTKRVWSVAFFADSKTLVSSSDDKTIRFWDVATGKEQRQIQHNQGVGQIALSPDDKLLASINLRHERYEAAGAWIPENRIYLWDTASGKELQQFTMKEISPVTGAGFFCLRFTPDGKTLLTGGSDGVLRFWDAATGREVRQLAGFSRSPSALAFAPDGKSLAIGDGFSSIRLIRLADGKDLEASPGHHGLISSIVVTPDCQTIVTTGTDNTLRFWEPTTGRELRRRAAKVPYFRTSEQRTDGRTYLTVGSDRIYRLHELATGKELGILRGHQAFYPFALSPDRKTLASTNADNSVRLLDPATGKTRHELMKVKHYVVGMSFAADGRTLVVWDADRIVTVWDAASGKKRREISIENEGGFVPGRAHHIPYSATLSPDGRFLAIERQLYGNKQGDLPVLDTSTGKVIARITTPGTGPGAMAFSPDGKTLAWGRRSEDICLSELATGRERGHFACGNDGAKPLTFAPDGKTLISGSNNTTALVWDLTGRLGSNNIRDKPLSADEMKEHWDALAVEDAAAAYRALQVLAADPERSVPYLRTRLHPVAAVEEKRLTQLITDLDSEKLAVREKAAMDLEKHGEAALHAMRKAIENQPTLETRRRLEQLIEKQEYEEWKPSAEGRRTRRAVEVLERIGTAEARRVLATLGEGAPGAWLTLDANAALDRLAKRSAASP